MKKLDEKKDNKMKKKNKKIWFILACVGILSISIIGLIIGIKGYQHNQRLMNVEELEAIKDVNTTLTNMYQPNRDEYGTGKVEIGGNIKEISIKDCIEKNLPKMPDDLWYYRHKLLLNKATSIDLINLTEDYYLQPEFIANTFTESGINRWKTIDVTRWTIYGYGTFPADQFTYTYPGEEFYVIAFFFSSFGVETYQGLKIIPVYPSSVIEREKGEGIIVNQTLSNRYIKIEIEPKEVLLEPTYPVFQKGWIKKVIIKVKVDENTPKGIYGIGFDVGGLDRRKDEEYSSRIGHKYIPFGGFHLGKEQLRVGINVQ